MAILVQYIDRRVKFLLPRRRLAKIRLIFRLLRPLYTSFLFDPDSPTSFFRLRPTRASLLGFPWNAPKLAAPLCLLSSLRAVKHLRLLRFLPFFPASFDSFRRHERRNSSPRFKFESSLSTVVSYGPATNQSRYHLVFRSEKKRG